MAEDDAVENDARESDGVSHEVVLVAFAGHDLIMRGAMREVVARCKSLLEAGEERRLALFDDETGGIIDIDFSGSEAEMLARLPQVRLSGPPAEQSVHQSAQHLRGPGRPKLGIVSREVSLLPRHWAWLAEQRGSASASLRRLVEAAKKSEARQSGARRAIDAAHRFMWDIAGDQPGFEEATRFLFAKDLDRFEQQTSGWPVGIQDQLAGYIGKARAGLTDGRPT